MPLPPAPAQVKVRVQARGGKILGPAPTVKQPLLSVRNVLTGEVLIADAPMNNGSSGTVFGIGEATLFVAVAPTVGSATGAPAIAAMGVGGITAPAASAAIDLTANQALSITATWSAASASNTLTGHNRYIDGPN